MMTLFIQSRITTTQGAQNVKKQEKIVKCLKYTLLIFSSIYVILQLLFIVLIVVKKDEFTWFQTQALVIIGFLILI